MLDAKWLLIGLVQAVFVLVVAPLFSGLSRTLRAKIHSRKGPDIFQNYRDLVKLIKRQEVVPAQASWVFRATPYLVMATTLLIAALIPILTVQSPLGRVGDAILVVYLFALVRFFFALAGMDSGSPFAGIGASREMGLAVLVEPTMVLVLIVLSLAAGSTDLGQISQKVAAGEISLLSPSVWLGMLALAFAAFIEAGKPPFDLAEAEQELQEGPLTEYSGRSLAIFKWSLYVKQVLVISLFLTSFFPAGSATVVSASSMLIATVSFCLKVGFYVLIAALVENSVARLIIHKAPTVTWVAFGMALASFVFQLAKV